MPGSPKGVRRVLAGYRGFREPPPNHSGGVNSSHSSDPELSAFPAGCRKEWPSRVGEEPEAWG